MSSPLRTTALPSFRRDPVCLVLCLRRRIVGGSGGGGLASSRRRALYQEACCGLLGFLVSGFGLGFMVGLCCEFYSLTRWFCFGELEWCWWCYWWWRRRHFQFCFDGGSVLAVVGVVMGWTWCCVWRCCGVVLEVLRCFWRWFLLWWRWRGDVVRFGFG
jgi:hypothetical protein